MNPWGRDDLMAIAAVCYCLGRRTYIVRDCADWLREHWKDFSESTRQVIKRDIEEAFIRHEQSPTWRLGDRCDVETWEKVRRLWADVEPPK